MPLVRLAALALLCAASACASTGLGADQTLGDDRLDLRRVMFPDLGGVWDCYQAELMRRPGTAGIVTLDLEVDGAGGVTEATVSGLDDGACVEKAARAMRFNADPAGKTVRVSYGVRLRPTSLAPELTGSCAPFWDCPTELTTDPAYVERVESSIKEVARSTRARPGSRINVRVAISGLGAMLEALPLSGEVQDPAVLETVRREHVGAMVIPPRGGRNVVVEYQYRVPQQ